MSNNTEYIQQFHDSDAQINKASLIYTQADHLAITRSLQNKNFIYIHNSHVIKDKSTLKRIASLVIPPAWAEVRIAYIENGHIQAVGRDKNGRKQYRYHNKWLEVRNRTKFDKMADFGYALTAIRERVEKDLSQSNLNKTKVLGLVIRLLEETHMRIGNQQYAKANNTYGLSTLRSKHVDISGNKLKFEFVGKRGKKHTITVRNKRLVKLVSQCEDIPGWELFKYIDSAGNKHSIDSAMVNQYIQDITSKAFTAKDFRTWAASLICYETLLQYSNIDDEQQKKQAIIKALDAARTELGNTRSVIKKYYVHPDILEQYLNDTLISPYSNKANSVRSLSQSECALLKMINK